MKDNKYGGHIEKNVS